MDRSEARARGIAARRALGAEARTTAEAALVRNVAALPEFAAARTVMIYRARDGEPSPEGLRALPEAAGKRFVYPRCVDGATMEALLPDDAAISPDAASFTEAASVPSPFLRDASGLPAPDPSRSALVPPESVDLVLCPCTACDPRGFRLGSGRGYYDRYLPRCRRARFFALAFEAQIFPLPAPGEWDMPMDGVVSEDTVRRSASR